MTTSTHSSADTNALIEEAVGADFVRAVLRGRRRNLRPRWRRVTARPVVVRGERHLQLVVFDAQKSFTENVVPDAGLERLRELAASGFSSILLETVTESIHVRYTKRDRVMVQRAAAERPPPSLDHDRAKRRVLPVASDPYLRAVGITTRQGRVRADRYAKFRQINEFLRIVADTGHFESASTVCAVDLGCGNAYLTFAAFHYLHHRLGIPTTLTGVDADPDAAARNTGAAASLSWQGLRFRHSSILEFEPDQRPDLVLALHACDTATDDALARAVRWRSELILCSPCCHHHLHAQMSARHTPAGFSEVVRHGILRQRVGDVLTDGLRSSILGLLGYRADVVQFVSPEHTDRNAMIRAVRTGGAPAPGRAEAYRELTASWGVTPYLEELLADELRAALAV
jgi:hypothetical protein